MTKRTTPAGPGGLPLLVTAQGLSALADHALLVVGMARLAELALPAWWAPVLKLVFTLAYVLLAPWVGHWADAWPQRRVLQITTLLKAAGVGLLVTGLHPLWALMLAGVGAAAAAPARYGWMAARVDPRDWVAANAWLEASIVVAAVAGIGLGGWLVRPEGGGATTAALVLLGVQLLALALLKWLPAGGAPAPRRTAAPPPWRAFVTTWQQLWRDADAALSLSVTTLFWGAAAVLQVAVLQWAGEVLSMPLHQASTLPLAVAAGLVVGAVWAGRHVPMAAARQLLPLGVLLGLGLALAALVVQQAAVAFAVLFVLGAIGGVLVVPLNALLQQRGHALVSTGRAIAAQNLAENTSILALLGLHAAWLAGGGGVQALLAGLGLMVAAGVAGLMQAFRPREAPASLP